MTFSLDQTTNPEDTDRGFFSQNFFLFTLTIRFLGGKSQLSTWANSVSDQFQLSPEKIK